MKKILCLFISVIMLASIFAGCGNNTASSGNSDESTSSSAASAASAETQKDTNKDEPVTLQWFTMAMEFPKAESQINDALHKTYPNITVEITTNTTNYDAILKTKIASGEAPDVFEIASGIPPVKTYADSNLIMDLTGKGFDSLVKSGLLKYSMYNNKLYNIPLNITGYGLIYNKDLFSKAGITEAPKTLSALKAACDKLQKAGIQPFASPYKDAWACAQALWALQSIMAIDAPEKLANDYTSGKSMKDEKLDSYMELFDISVKESGNRPISTGFTEMCHAIGLNKAAMGLQGDWAAAEITKVAPNANIGFAPLPVSENPSDANFPMVAGTTNVISATTKYPEQSINFLKWLLSKDGIDNTVVSLRKQPSTSVEKSDIKINALSTDLSNFLSSGAKPCSMFNSYYPQGFENSAGQSIQEYISKGKDRNQLYKDLDALWTKYSK